MYFSTYCQNPTQTTNQIKSDTVWQGHNQIWHNFLSKNIKLFQWSSKLKFLIFMKNVNWNNGNETKSDIFPLDIFKSDTISFFIKKYKVFQWLSKSKFLSFMTKVHTKKWKWNKTRHFPMGDIQIWHIFFYEKIFKYFSDLQNQNFSALWLKYGNETKLDIFSLGIFKSFSFFVGHRILKLQWHFVINIFQFHWKSEHKQSKVKKKLNRTYANLIVFSLIYNVVHYLNDFLKFISW